MTLYCNARWTGWLVTTLTHDIDKALWAWVFATRLIQLAEESGNIEKAHFARSFAYEIAALYLAAGPLPDAHRNPVEAARYEFDCWLWWGNRAINTHAAFAETNPVADSRAVPD